MKVTDTTPMRDESFTIELNRAELDIIHSLLGECPTNLGFYESEHAVMDMYNAVNTVGNYDNAVKYNLLVTKRGHN